MVDDDDYEELNQYKWGLSGNGYVTRVERVGRKSIKFYLHRFVNKTPDGLMTDHINRNKLDNRKSNLRSATLSVNKLNTGLQSNNSSGLKRICWRAGRKVWSVQIVKRIASKKQILYEKTFKNWDDAVDALLEAEKLHLDPEFWQQHPPQTLTQLDLNVA